MTRTDGPDWDAVRVQYEAGEVPVTELAAAHNITVDQLNYRRTRDHWRMRHPGMGRQRRRSLLGRMLRLIENQIAQLETKVSGEPMNATEMRMLESMTKAIDKIIALDATEKRAVTKRVRPDPELEAIRERLAQRISELDTDD